MRTQILWFKSSDPEVCVFGPWGGATVRGGTPESGARAGCAGYGKLYHAAELAARDEWFTTASIF